MALSRYLMSSDYVQLSRDMNGLEKETIARRINSSSWENFKLPELKQLVKYLSRLPIFANHQTHIHATNAQKKEQLIKLLKWMVQTAQAIQNANNDTQQNHNAAMAPTSTASASSSSAAFPSADLYGNPQYPNYLHGNTPAVGVNATQSGFPQYFNMPPQVSNLGTGYPLSSRNSAPSLPSGYIGSASASASNPVDVEKALSSPAYKQTRSPFDNPIAQLAKQVIMQPTQISIIFQVPTQIFSGIRRSTKSDSSLAKTYDIQLRLFAVTPPSFVGWEKPNWRLKLNNVDVSIPEPKKMSKTKKKGFEVHRPLLLNDFVIAYQNRLDVEYIRTSYAAELFRGVVLIEVVTEKDLGEVGRELTFQHEQALLKSRMLAIQHECGVCKTTEKLQRCSRCKNQWYCSAEHQKQHWPEHRLKCLPSTAEQEKEREEKERQRLQAEAKPKFNLQKKVKKEKSANSSVSTTNSTSTSSSSAALSSANVLTVVDDDDEDDDDGLEEGDAVVSLTCPLLIDRINVAAKGKKCMHARCFDLDTYLVFSQSSGIWQCFTADTQILTAQGFKFVEKLCMEDRVAAFNPNTQQLEYEQPIAILPPRSGTQLLVDVDDSCDSGVALSTTADHQWYADVMQSNTSNDAVVTSSCQSSLSSSSFKKLSAIDLHCPSSPKQFRVLACAEGGVKVSDTLDEFRTFPFATKLCLHTSQQFCGFLRFYGFFLMSGSILPASPANPAAIRLTVLDDHHAKQVLNALRAFVPECGYRTIAPCSNASQLSIEVSHSELIDYFAEQYLEAHSSPLLEQTANQGLDSDYWSEAERCSAHFSFSCRWFLSFVWALSRPALRNIIEALALHNSSSIHTQSIRFRDELVRVLLHAGYSPHFQAVDEQMTAWIVSFTDSTDRTQPVLNSTQHVKIRQSFEPTYCLSVPHHLVIARKAQLRPRMRGDLNLLYAASRAIVVGQCPLCYKPLPYHDLEIDGVMNAVLKELDKEITQIRILPSGDYEPVIEADMQAKKKRKTTPTPNAPQPSTTSSNANGSSNGNAVANGSSNGHANNGGTSSAAPSPSYPMSATNGTARNPLNDLATAATSAAIQGAANNSLLALADGNGAAGAGVGSPGALSILADRPNSLTNAITNSSTPFSPNNSGRPSSLATNGVSTANSAVANAGSSADEAIVIDD